MMSDYIIAYGEKLSTRDRSIILRTEQQIGQHPVHICTPPRGPRSGRRFYWPVY